jgi:Tfp pilus assembly protein PilO
VTLWRRIFEERKRVLVPLAIVLVANIAILLLAVLPLQSAVATAGVRAADAMRELAEARIVERQATQARGSKEQADEELRKFYTEVLPKDFPTAEATTTLWLTEAAEANGLIVKGSSSHSTDIRDSRLSRAESKITLEGRYPSIRRFLHDLETAKEFVIVDRVELAERATGEAASGVLELSLTVSTYFLNQRQQ